MSKIMRSAWSAEEAEFRRTTMIGKLDNEHINMLLKTEVTGHLGCCVDNKPYVVPISYVYDDDYIYGHTSEGMKINMMRKNPNVCIEVEHVKNSMNWQSVIAFGQFEELKGKDANRAMDKFVKKLATYLDSEIKDSKDFNALEMVSRQIHMGPKNSVFYRIKLTEKHGRYETN
jgi:uncharacterized protein